MDKFGRNYALTIQLQTEGFLTVRLPLTIEFDITREISSQANTSTIRIYNLSKEHRNQIRFNRMQQADFRTITLQAGYGTMLSTVHSGQIQEAYSYREENNFITEITSFDGYSAFLAQDLQNTYPGSDTNPILKKDLIAQLMTQLPNVSVGAIGNYIGQFYRPYSFSSSPTEALREETGKGFFIDNGKAHALQDNEYIVSKNIPLINAASGLLGTPRLQQNILSFDMLFEPSISVGYAINLQSTTFQDIQGNNLNGLYKVNGLKHRGMISSAVCGDAVTTLMMYNSIGPLTGVKSAS